MSTAFHPQTDGQTERMDCTVEDMLRHFVSPTMTDWDELRVHAQFAISNARQKPVQNTPFYLNHGRHPRTFLSALLERGRTLPSKSKYPASAPFAQHMQSTMTHAKTCMLNAQQRQKHYYDKRHVPSVSEVGAEVLLATTDLHLRTTGTRKLIPRWDAPFKVLAHMCGTVIVWICQTACIRFTMCSMSLSSSHTQVMVAHNHHHLLSWLMTALNG